MYFTSVTPLISCLMVTKGRVDMVKNSIADFVNQTYPKKELIILSQGSDVDNNRIRSFLQDYLGQKIQFFVVSPKSTLGSLRNLSCEIAQGEFLCQWDDDDLYHRDRLMTQFSAIHHDPNIVASAYSCFIKYYTQENKAYWCDWSNEQRPIGQVLHGSVMFRRSCFHQHLRFYPEYGYQSDRGEDLNVMNKLLDLGEVAKISDGHHYVYTYHGGNTYLLEHHNETLVTRWGKLVLDGTFLQEKLPLIKEVMQSHCLAPKIYSLKGFECEI